MLKDQAQTIWLGSKENGLFRLVPRNRPYHYEVYHYMNNPSDPYSISDNKYHALMRIITDVFGLVLTVAD